ncbi:hypothetical protein H8K52_12715 [Undibacterium seohonense]|uniref:BIG2 domain-containing protein n=1 Tax=Undibacterium seohonense TaxID=1344950 RepID=A0ABR6X5L4_9BURK|nr:hypothetical protein [Undibacterium seohonense]MBC3808207.1 hypothetical protein [Undibacterium seohonense]
MATEIICNPMAKFSRVMQSASVCLCLILMILGLSGCGGGAGTVGTPTGRALYTTAPGSINLAVGASVNYDIGGGTATYKASSSSVNVLSVEVKGTVLSLKGLQNGTAQVVISDATGTQLGLNVTVGDGGGSVSLFVTAPKDLTLAAGLSGSYTIAGGKPGYFVSSSNPSVAAVGINGNSFIISGIKSGVAQIIVLDSKGDAVSLNVTVGNGSAAMPLFVSAAGTISLKVAETQDYIVSGGVGPYLASSNNQSVATVTLSGNAVSVKGISKGSAQITLFDASGASVSTTVVVDPTGIATPFYLAAPSSVTMAIGAKSTYSLGGGTAPYIVSSSNTTVANASLNALSNAVTVDALREGEAQILVFDATGTKVSIELTVGSGNANPTPLYTTAGTGVIMPKAASNTYIIGGGKSPYTVTSSNTRVATVSMGASSTTFSVTSVAVGSAAVSVFDATGNSVNFSVTVSASDSNINLFTTAGDVLTLPIGVSDSYVIGGGSAPYIVSSSNVGVARATVNGSRLEITPISAGSASITVFDSSGASVTINVTVTNTNSTPIDVQPNGASGKVGNILQFLLSAGKPPYAITVNNPGIATVSPLTVNASGGSFNATLLNEGITTVTIIDALGQLKAITLTVSPGTPSLVNVQPDGAGGNVGDALQFLISSGTPPYTITVNNPSIASVTPSPVPTNGGSFTANLLNVGSTVVTITDALGQIKAFSLTASQINTSLRLSPNPFLIGEDSTATVNLNIFGGTPPYRAYTSDERLSRVSVVGSVLSVAPGTNGDRCFTAIDTDGKRILFGTFDVTITVLDSLGAAATSIMTIKDNGRGDGVTPPFCN